MTHNYTIQGMSCQGCRSHVETTLSKVPGVQGATVDLEKGEAAITMDSHIPLEVFQAALAEDGGRYGISLPGQDRGDGAPNREQIYGIQGMSCQGCRSHVESALSKVAGVKQVTVDLEKGEANITMESPIPLETFQEALAGEGDRYGISLLGQGPPPGEGHRHPQAPKGQGTGVFYCPMQCEGDRTYGAPGDCPVCGMDLVEEQNLSTATGEQW